MIPVAVHMLPMQIPPKCSVVAETRVGKLTGCFGRRGELLRLHTRAGRVITFGRVRDAAFSGVAVSPDGRWLLLQGDLECDTRGAFVVPTRGGVPQLVPRPRQGCDSSLGTAIGWTPDNRAVVDFEPEQCRCSLRAGIYALDPRTRSP